MDIRSMTDAQLLSLHQKFGLATRHDLTSLDGRTLPKYTVLVNVGQPEGIVVRRFDSKVDVVICGTAGPEHMSDIKVGNIVPVNPTKLLVALNEIEGDCECVEGDPWCTRHRNV